MNWFLGILILCGLICSSFQQDQTLLDSEWETYKRDFDKTYATPEEEETRKNNFIENWKKVIEHNELFERGKIKYELAVSDESDSDETELADFMSGLDLTNELPDRDNITIPQNDQSSGRPKFFDWRKMSVVTPVRNQRKCGSSWAMAVNAIVETRLTRITVSINNIDFSEQQILDCADSTINSGCKGGAPFKFLRSLADMQAGIAGENAYRYRGRKSNCKRRWREENYKILGYDYYKKNQPNEYGMENVLIGFGPFIMGIVATENFYHYKKGIFTTDPKCTPDLEPNHLVLVVGYGEESDGTKYWIIKNSFGKKWGEKGYMRIVRGKNLCKVGNFFGIVNVSFPLF